MTADFGAYYRSPPPAETALPGSIAAADFANSNFAQNLSGQAAVVPATSRTARGSVQEFATKETPASAAGSTRSAGKVPVIRSTARAAKRAPPPLTGPVTARDGDAYSAHAAQANYIDAPIDGGAVRGVVGIEGGVVSGC
jgi:hypothetical protein